MTRSTTVEWLTNSVTVDVIPDSSGNFTYDFTNLTDRAVYYYTSFASNGTETAWSGKIYMMRTGEGRPASAQLAVTFGGESNSSLAGAYSN